MAKRIIINGAELRGEAMPRIVADFQKKVVGCKIIGAGYWRDDEDDEVHSLGTVWPVLMVETPKGEKFLITGMSDDEGNGPGVLQAGDEVLCETRAR